MAADRSGTAILVTGAGGQVAFELMRSLSPLGIVVGVDRKDCDLSRPDDIRRVVQELRPRVIVNAGAYTAVDRAESEAAVATAVNSVAPRVLAEEAQAIGSLLVHYSTDYVFDGTKDGWYVESDQPNPLSVYGKTKLDGERNVTEVGGAHLIFRTSWAFGTYGSSFPKSIIRAAKERTELSVVADQFGAPTASGLIADVTAHIVAQYLRSGIADDAYGLYHLASAGETTWFDYARHVVGVVTAAGFPLQTSVENIKRIKASEYRTAAPRPANSRLDTGKLQRNFDLRLPPWQQGVDQMLAQIIDAATLMASRSHLA
jgi:dTDP-4-dehydrorhamnose reductase